MKSFRLSATAGLGLLLLLGPGISAAAAQSAVVLEARHEFGRVRQGEKVLHAFSVHNSGDLDLAFAGVELSMPGMTCRLPQAVPAGGDAAIAVEWSMEHFQGHLEGQAVIRTNDPARPTLTLVLAGDVVGSIEIRPLPAVFLSAFRGEGASRVLTVVNNESRPLAVRLVETSGAPFSAALEAVESGKVFRVTVRPMPEAPPGRYEEAIVLETDNPSLNRLKIPVHLYIKPDLYANPDRIDFEQVPLDRLTKDAGLLGASAQTVLLKKREGTFRIVTITTDVPGLSIARTPEGQSGTFRLDATLAPDRLRRGPLSGTIRIRTDDPRYPEIHLPVSGTVK